MDFPIIELIGHTESRAWLIAHFHGGEFGCPDCPPPASAAYPFRTTKKSQLPVYRCKRCQRVYNLYTGPVFEQRHLPPEKAVLLVRGVLKGDPAVEMARELNLHRTTVLEIRHDLQDNACLLQPETALADERPETDEMFQNAGEKRGGTL